MKLSIEKELTFIEDQTFLEQRTNDLHSLIFVLFLRSVHVWFDWFDIRSSGVPTVNRAFRNLSRRSIVSVWCILRSLEEEDQWRIFHRHVFASYIFPSEAICPERSHVDNWWFEKQCDRFHHKQWHEWLKEQFIDEWETTDEGRRTIIFDIFRAAHRFPTEDRLNRFHQRFFACFVKTSKKENVRGGRGPDASSDRWNHRKIIVWRMFTFNVFKEGYQLSVLWR